MSRGELVEVGRDLVGRAGGGVGEHLVDGGGLRRAQEGVDLLVGELVAAAEEGADADAAGRFELAAALSSVSAAITLTPAITYGLASCADGLNCSR